MDVARLQMEVDSRPVKEATQALKGLEEQSARMESAYGDVNAAAARSHQVLEEKRRATLEEAQSASVAAEAQWNLADALLRTDEAVEDTRLGFELLRLEYEQGDLTQEEYLQGLQQLKDRLQDLDVDTLGSVRTTRMLNREIVGLGEETEATGRMMTGATTTLNSLSSAVTSLATGSGDLSARLARAGQSLGVMTRNAGDAGTAIQSLSEFILSPAGLVFGLGAAIPLVVSLTKRFSDHSKTLFDAQRAGQAYSQTLDGIMSRMRDLGSESIFDTSSLQEQLEWSKALEESYRNRLEELEQERVAIIDMTKGMGLSGQQSSRMAEISRERATVEEFIEKELDRQRELQSEIRAIEQARMSDVADRLVQERQSREAAEWMQEHEQRMADELLDQRQRAEERVRETIQRQKEEMEGSARMQEEILERHRQLRESPPPIVEMDDDAAAMSRSLTRQRLAEDARLALAADSVTKEKLIRLQMEQEFERERLELIKQGISDEESLNNLRIIQQRRLTEALKRELKGVDETTRELQFTFESAFENAILKGEGFLDVLRGIEEDIARIALRTAVTRPLGEALAGAISDINPFTRSVNDALILKDGQIIEPHPDDHILAFKDPAILGDGGPNMTMQVHVHNAPVGTEARLSQTPGGAPRLDVFLKPVLDNYFDSGWADRVLGRNYGISRRGVRHG